MTPHDYLLSFDELNPRGDIDKVVQSTVERARRDATVTGSPIVPIIHVPQRKDGEYRTEWLPDIAHGVASALQPEMIAIPERELGAGVFSRVRTLVAVRQKLSELYRYVPIHILGTGYPTSIALLAAAGADSFDGLEWCRFVMDADLGTLHHFHHYDFYEYQAAVAASPITAASVADDKLNYAAKAVFHNLDAYGTWLSELRSALSNDRQLIAFLTKLLPDGSIKQVLGSLPGVT
jgi:queuine/archaeosine tRNA-ribosyltransferase